MWTGSGVPDLSEPQQLRRELGLVDAVLLGLGSIVGTGVYVSLGFVIGLAGVLTLPVIFVAGFIALCNGLSSAQLASVHPVAGGTYEYGYHFLGPWRGRLAGWMFLIAKTASAATAALGTVVALGAVTLTQSSTPVEVAPTTPGRRADVEQVRTVRVQTVTLTQSSATGWQRSALAVAGVLCLGLLVHLGVRRTSKANLVLVLIAIFPLIAFVIFVGIFPALFGHTASRMREPSWLQVGSAVALAFVAFTGYGRVATLGEEVKNPRRTIPVAVIVTLLACVILYAAVAWSCRFGFSVDDETAAASAQPVQTAVAFWSSKTTPLHWMVRVGAIAAMIGVVLNLILGLSRVVLAMARRGDLPKVFANVQDAGRSPGWAVLLVTIAIAAVSAVGGIKTSWTVSAMTVLVYYALTNWAALRVPVEDAFVPRWVSVAGLAGCVFFAPFAVIELMKGV